MGRCGGFRVGGMKRITSLNHADSVKINDHKLCHLHSQVWVCFPEKPNWIGKLDDLIPTRGMSHAVSANKRVRVKSSVVKPKKGWNQINRECKSTENRYNSLNGWNHAIMHNSDMVD